MRSKSTRDFRVRSFLILVFLGIFSGFGVLNAQDGAALFKKNCAVCHTTTDQKLTGPGLGGVMDRVPSEDWLFSWIKNNQKVIKSGDPYAIAIYEKFKRSPMNTFEHLKDEEINAIIAYIKEPTPAGGEDAGDEAKWYAAQEEPAKDYSGTLTVLFVIGFLLVIIAIFSGLNKSLRKLISDKDGENPTEEMGVLESINHWAKNNKKWSGAIAIIFTLFFLGKAWAYLIDIGVYGGDEISVENYAPTQPIKFPHDLHAGKNEIDCEYCHSSALKSKTSGIPSVNVCMNCHKAIPKGELYGTEEIGKIYEHAGWNPDEGMYNHGTDDKPIWKDTPRTDRPIEWVKVHNLPDFVYFNHSQHVVVGKQKCQTCHGPVEEMRVLEQHSALTMGWCVNCHRETEVAHADNKYYDRIHAEAKEAYKHKEDFKFTVEKIGGLECAKCHY